MTLIVLESFTAATTETPEPILHIARTLSDDPKLRKSKTLRSEPNLQVLRRLSEEPRCTAPITLMLPATRPAPNIERQEPMRTPWRKLNAEPI